MGTDQVCSNCGSIEGGARGVAYDYALYVRNPVVTPASDPSLAGNSSATAASDCSDILTQQPTATSGVYWVNFGGPTSTQVVCNMDLAPGGWTLVFNLDTGDGATRYYGDYDFWEGTGGLGGTSSALTADYKSAAAFAHPWNNLLIEVHQDDISQVGWRSWTLNGTTSLRDALATTPSTSPSRLTLGSTAASTGGVWSQESIILPNGDLYTNRKWGNTNSYDIARFHNAAVGFTDDANYGIGSQMNAQDNGGTPTVPGYPKYPACEVGSVMPWSNYYCLGTDRTCENGNCGSTTGNGHSYNYDYAIWAR